MFGVFRFRIATSGQELLPKTGGYLLVGAIHRGWMDPFLVLHALPLEPRAWFLGSAASAFDTRWKEWLLRRLGGMLPVWRGGIGIETHVASARAVIGARAVFAVFPEGGILGPVGTLSTFRVGAALIALRTGAPIVPFAMAGTEELYRGRRMASRILPPTSARELLRLAADDQLPAEGSREELELGRLLTDRCAELLAGPVAELSAAIAEPPGRKKRWRGLTWLFLSRPRKRG